MEKKGPKSTVGVKPTIISAKRAYKTNGMSPVLSLTTIFLQKNCDFLPLCGAPTQTTNLTINVIKERHAVCHRCLPCHYSTTTEHKLKKMTKYGACSFDVF